MVKKGRFLLVCLALIIAAFAMVACGKEEIPEKMAFDEVLTTTNGETNKTINSELTVDFICYDSNGAPGKVQEKFNLFRATDGTTHYASGELRTTELTNIMEKIIDAAIAAMETFFGADGSDFDTALGYLYGDSYLSGRAGMAGDTINGQVELCEEDAEPLYDFADDGSDIISLTRAWGAMKYSDFLRLKESLEVESLTNADFVEMFYSAFSLPIDWNTVTDTAKATYVKLDGATVAEYDLIYPAADVVALIKDTLEKYMSEIWTEEEDYEVIKKYYDKYVGLVFEVFNVSDLRVVATVDKDSRLVSMNTDFSVKMILTDDQVIGVFREEGTSEYNLKRVGNVLEFLHLTLFGCSTKEAKKFEMELRLSLKDSYTYGNAEFDTESSVFTPFDAEVPARATVRWVEDEEDVDGGYWDFSFPEKVEDLIYGSGDGVEEGDEE